MHNSSEELKQRLVDFLKQPGGKELLSLHLRWYTSENEDKRRREIIKSEVERIVKYKKQFDFLMNTIHAESLLSLKYLDDEMILNFIQGVNLIAEIYVFLGMENKQEEFCNNPDTFELPKPLNVKSKMSAKLTWPVFAKYFEVLESAGSKEYLVAANGLNVRLKTRYSPSKVVKTNLAHDILKYIYRKGLMPKSISDIQNIKEEMLIEDIQSMDRIRSAVHKTHEKRKPNQLFIYYLNGNEHFKIKLIEFLKKQYPKGKGSQAAIMVFALEECNLINTPENKSDLARSIGDEWGVSYDEKKEYEAIMKKYRELNKIRETQTNRTTEKYKNNIIAEITKIKDFKSKSCTT